MKRLISLLMAALLAFCTMSCDKEDVAYIFTYFNKNGAAGLQMSYSYDGYTWTPVNGNQPLLTPMVGGKLMRDPSICQGPDGIFHLVWTTGWWENNIGHATSKDLLSWSAQQEIPVMKDYPAVINTWAPELFYNDEEGLFYIFWASTIPDAEGITTGGGKEDGKTNHRIYCTTTKDFKEFSPTRLWFNPDFSAIDATVIRSPRTGQYIMAVKNENAGIQDEIPAEKNIRITWSDKMKEGFPTEVSGPIDSTGAWMEGPTMIYIGDDLLIYYDKYKEHRFGAALSHDDGCSWEDVSDRISLPKGTRHGTAIAVPRRYVDAISQ